MSECVSGDVAEERGVTLSTNEGKGAPVRSEKTSAKRTLKKRRKGGLRTPKGLEPRRVA